MARIIPVRPPIQAARPTVSGVGLVNGGDTSALYSTDFTEYALGSDVHNTGANGFQWIGGNGDGRPVVVDCPFEPGTRALRFKWADFSEDAHYWEEQRFNIGQPLTEVWIEFYVWFPDGTEPDGDGGTLHRWDHVGDGGSATNRKFLALWPNETYTGATPRSVLHLWLDYGSGDSTINIGRTKANQDDLVRYDSADTGGIFDNTATMVGAADRGRWVQFRFYQKVANWAENTGIHRAWKDGEMILNITNDPYYDSGGVGGSHHVQLGYLGGDDSSSARHQALTYQFYRNFSVYSTDPGWETVHPNEPEGAVMVTDRAFVALDEDGWEDFDGTNTFPATLSMADGVLTVTFPAGHPGSGSSSRCTTSNYNNWSGTQAVYIHIQIQYSANWYGQDGSGVNKILYIGDEATNPVVLDAHGAGSSTLRLRVATQGGETVNFDWDDATTGETNEVSPTAADAEIPRGEWVDIELLLEPNTPGSSNGTIHAWVNGVKTQQYSGRPIYAPGTNLAVQRWHVHPIYGGGGGSAIPADQTLKYRMLYLSVVN